MPLDLDFLEFTCTQELVFLNAVAGQVAVCPAILDALTQLHSLINIEKEKSKQQIVVVQRKDQLGDNEWPYPQTTFATFSNLICLSPVLLNLWGYPEAQCTGAWPSTISQ